MKNVVCVAVVLAVTLALALLAGIFYQTRAVDCGMCGAYVHEWWSVRNMDDTEFIDVCEHCYLDVRNAQ